ncbi:MAG TPA: carboxypeptidase-like regulatory domain-containing protein [Bryobacteraceae bacterium]|nr:carboxypeptidase-like regulatory domain-containing protein [Bryobacteraceae bacterium]
MAFRGGWVLTGILLAGPGFAQTPAARCTLAGTVVNSVTNAGIARVLVSYEGASSGFRFTDTGGNIQVASVPCGQYSVAVSKPGFVSGQEDSTEPFLLSSPIFREAIESQSEQVGNPPKPANVSVNLTPDSQAARIPLVPVASITGTVLDENGEPIAGVVVQGIAVKATPSGSDFVPTRTVHTDDRGRYELLGLTPGDYVVRLAGESSTTQYFQGNSPNPNNDHRGMQPVYYSNADSLAAAMVLHLAPATQANAEFRQATEPAFDVNGRLSGFIPQSWIRLRLYRDGDRIPVARSFVNIASGQFRITDVPRGSYTLRAEDYQADPALWLAAEEPIRINAEPIRDLVVQLSAAVDIPVSVSYEAGAQNDEIIELMLVPQHSRENMRQLSTGKLTGQTPTPQASPAFTNVIPDKYKLTILANGGTGYVASAKLGDLDVLHGQFNIGGAAGEIHVTIRGDSASVEGQVTFQGKPAVGAQVQLIPASGDGTGLKMGFSYTEGRYEIQAVPPGDYRIKAWMGSPSFKEILSGTGETLTLQPSEKQTVALEATAAEQK